MISKCTRGTKLKLFPEINYRKSSIRSRPCIILDPKFHRLLLEVLKRFFQPQYYHLNKTKDLALVKNAASAGDKVELGLFR